MKTLWLYIYAIKYWAQGDAWRDAIAFADSIVNGFINENKDRNK